VLSSLETTARVDPTLPWSLPSSGFLQARLPVVSVFPTARPFVVSACLAFVCVSRWVLGGAHVCDIHGYAGHRLSSDRISSLAVASR
jgi:hypothetical protein